MTRRLHTTSEAAAELGVPAKIVSSWRTRGQVTPASWIRGRGRRGVEPLYDLDDLRPLAARYAPRRPATRRPDR